MGLEALAGIGWVDVTALGSIVGHQALQRHVTATWSAEPVPFGTLNPLKTKMDGWGSNGWGSKHAAVVGWSYIIGLGCRNMADGWTCHYNRPWLPEHGGWMDAPLLMEGAS